MQQYLEIITEVLSNGTWKGEARENMDPTISRFGIMKRFNLQEGFPLLTTKEMFLKGVIHELIWFLRGDTNIYYLHKNGVKKFWHEDGYKYYLKTSARSDTHVRSFEEWCASLDDEAYAMQHGSLGKIYPYQWRCFTGIENGKVYHLDQLMDVINAIKEKPLERYKVVTAWNPSELKNMALPACHMLYQFNCRPMTFDQRVQWAVQNLDIGLENLAITEAVLAEDSVVPKYFLDCSLTQRSCDTALGVPVNIASYALLTMIVAHFTNTAFGDFIWFGNDVHIYKRHLAGLQEQIGRKPFPLPTMQITGNWETLLDIKYEDFKLVGYQHHPKIEFELLTGLSKK